MKAAQLLSVVCITAGLAASPVLAKDKPGKRSGRNREETKVAAAAAPKDSAKEPWITAEDKISDNERQVIRAYVQDYRGPKHRGKKPKHLPPGLAKKVARGEQLPPGWQKKCVVGQIMPVEVYEKTHPIPPELTVKLPSPPPGTITITIGGKVVRLVKATREILDVFDVHVGR